MLPRDHISPNFFLFLHVVKSVNHRKHKVQCSKKMPSELLIIYLLTLNMVMDELTFPGIFALKSPTTLPF